MEHDSMMGQPSDLRELLGGAKQAPKGVAVEVGDGMKKKHPS